jgi:hypothetical protein
MPERTDMSFLDQNGEKKEPPMQAAATHAARTRRPRALGRQGVVIELNSLARMRREQEDRPLRCLSSGYLSGECSCAATIPAAVVAAAWRRELAAGNGENRFFHFAWHGDVWLAFGLADGQTKGVYCPTHRAQRDARWAGCEAQHSAQPARAATGA